MSVLRDPARPTVRLRAVGLLVVGVAAAHLVLLEPWLLPARHDAPPASTTAMQTRSIVPPGPRPEAPAVATAPPSVLPTTRPAKRSPALPDARPSPAPVEAAVAPPAPPAPRVPVYATSPAPSTRLHYTVERGSARGEATLDWSVEDDGRYTLQLQADVDGRPLPGALSRGAFDPAGLAPERFVETRRQRALRAANFEREAGEIAFSGPGHRAALTPGAQDRLSWWLQLAAVLQADPSLQEVKLSVTGARGDSRVWTFHAVPPATEDVVPLRHFHRAPDHPYDTEVDVWLDPALHHLPARVRLLFRQGGEATTFTRGAAR